MSGPGHPRRPLLVVGVGNVLLRDDGAGIHAANALAALADRGAIELPPATLIVDGGDCVDVLPFLRDARGVVFVDALATGGAPGTVAVVDRTALLEDAGANPSGLGDVLRAAVVAGTLPAATALVGIAPAVVAPGFGLSDEISEAIPTLLAKAVEELWRLAGASHPVQRSRRSAGAIEEAA